MDKYRSWLPKLRASLDASRLKTRLLKPSTPPPSSIVRQFLQTHDSVIRFMKDPAHNSLPGLFEWVYVLVIMAAMASMIWGTHEYMVKPKFHSLLRKLQLYAWEIETAYTEDKQSFEQKIPKEYKNPDEKPGKMAVIWKYVKDPSKLFSDAVSLEMLASGTYLASVVTSSIGTFGSVVSIETGLYLIAFHYLARLLLEVQQIFMDMPTRGKIGWATYKTWVLHAVSLYNKQMNKYYPEIVQHLQKPQANLNPDVQNIVSRIADAAHHLQKLPSKISNPAEVYPTGVRHSLRESVKDALHSPVFSQFPGGPLSEHN